MQEFPIRRFYPQVAPVRERGLKSDEYFDKAKAAGVAPVRERGLKLVVLLILAALVWWSLPRGSVD